MPVSGERKRLDITRSDDLEGIKEIRENKKFKPACLISHNPSAVGASVTGAFILNNMPAFSEYRNLSCKIHIFTDEVTQNLDLNRQFTALRGTVVQNPRFMYFQHPAFRKGTLVPYFTHLSTRLMDDHAMRSKLIR